MNLSSDDDMIERENKKNWARKNDPPVLFAQTTRPVSAPLSTEEGNLRVQMTAWTR